MKALKIIVGLLLGILLGEFVVTKAHFLDAVLKFLNDLVNLFAKGWVTKTVIFALLVGSIIKLLNDSGAVEQFVAYISKKYKKLDSSKGALFLAYILGIVIFIESSITSLIAATVAKPLCDKNGVSREKLAYVCDSTSAPVCSLIPFNAWGALLIGLIATAISANVIEGNAVNLLIKSIPFNIYSILTVIFVFFVIKYNINIGAMRYAKAHKFISSNRVDKKSSIMPLVLPIIVLIVMVPISLYYTGKGDITKGSGSTSVFYAVIASLVFIYIYYRIFGLISHKQYFKSLFEGIGDMIPIVTILLFAFLIGGVIKELNTASYLSSIMQGNIPIFLIPALIFIVGAITSFATGTSWGTFSIMMPIALNLGATFDLNIPLVIGAVVSGGIFGDHVSPISDTTIISSMASGCEHISHVRTQMPYALIIAFLTTLIYIALPIII